MNIQDALRSKKPIRRKSWVTKEFLLSELITFDENDILATDWEVEEEKPTEIIFEDEMYPVAHRLHFLKDDNDVGIGVQDGEDHGYYTLTEEDIDKLLTFLYNNTEIGKERVIPF